MSRLSITSRERLLVLVGCVLIGLAGVATRVLPSWRTWRAEVLDAAAEAVEDAERAELSIRLLGATLDSLDQRRERLVSYSAALAGGGARSSAAAALVARVSGAAAAAHVRLGSIQVRADTAGGGVFTRISLRADATGDIRGIVRMLADLERGPPLLAVREWTVTAPEPGAPPQRPESLQVELKIEGIAINRRPGAAP